MEKNPLSRRRFLEKSAVLGAAGLTGLHALTSCKKGNSHSDYVFPP
ncbi:MAG: twin-arginine translocation signal domain-containing protein, partial [Mariniphaga sp.]